MCTDVTGKTKIVGIFGHPLEHTLSPRMHNAAFRALRLDMIYLPFAVKGDSLKEAMEAVRTLDFMGVNLTRPHKMAVLQHLDDMTDEAREIGAVNTVVNREGTLVGHNTDATGFLRSLRDDYGFDPKGKIVVLFGAGGAARGICWVLSQAGTERIVIVNRTFEKAEALAVKWGGHALHWHDPTLKQETSGADLLVNATSSSLNVNHHWVQRKSLVYDIVYGRRQSTFLHAAKQRGAQVGNGLSMLLHQGALAFELWTGQKAPLQVMRKALVQGK